MENNQEVKIVTPKELGAEFDLDPKVIRRILRSRFEKKTSTWQWEEGSEELKKVRSYIPKKLQAMEEEKERARIIVERRREKKANLEAQRAAQQEQHPQEYAENC